MQKYKYYNLLLGLLIIIILAAIIMDAMNGKKMESLTERFDEKTIECSDLQIDIANKSMENESLIQEMDSLELDIASLHAELEVTMNELQEYKDKSAKYFTNNYELSDIELEILYRVVEAEATGGQSDAKINVTHVILNRIMSDRFPNTISKVVFQNRQFSPISDGRYYVVKVTESTKNAVNAAINGLDTTDGSLFFMYRPASDVGNVNWFDKKLDYKFTDSIGHEFYGLK